MDVSSPSEEFPSLIEHLQSIEKTISGHSLPRDNSFRREALRIAKSIVATLEDPQEVVIHWGYERVWQQACLRLGIDLKLFHILVSKGGAPITASELAAEANAETLFVARMMRVITSTGFAAEVGPQWYVQTALTKAVTIPSLEASVKSQSNDTVQITANISAYFTATGYQCPRDNLSCPFSWVYDTPKSWFEWTHDSPERRADMELRMEALRTSREPWTQWFPVERNLLFGALQGPGEVLLVDVGGGGGEDITDFARQFPAAKGRLVLQDLPEVLGKSSIAEARIELLPHDFFNPQPIRGARAYYTHFVFHNWSDDKARIILGYLKSAMTPGYSKLFLNESVIPDENCPALFAAHDMNMMAILAGIKRSRSQWIDLLHSVGFEDVSVWTSPHPGEEDGIIEAAIPAK